MKSRLSGPILSSYSSAGTRNNDTNLLVINHNSSIIFKIMTMTTITITIRQKHCYPPSDQDQTVCTFFISHLHSVLAAALGLHWSLREKPNLISSAVERPRPEPETLSQGGISWQHYDIMASCKVSFPSATSSRSLLH